MNYIYIECNNLPFVFNGDIVRLLCILYFTLADQGVRGHGEMSPPDFFETYPLQFFGRLKLQRYNIKFANMY